MMTVQEWTEKLNKVDGNIYTVEEAVPVVGGVYEGMLRHDNINVATFAVYTGPKLTGERIEVYALSTPSMTPWKRSVRVYADVDTVYLSYETDGDTVEAEDINRVQAAIAGTQEALNAEEARAAKAEEGLTQGLRAETDRAEHEEARLDERVDTEEGRAKAEEDALKKSLSDESVRAKAEERKLEVALAAEKLRAETEEGNLAGRITAESARAEAAEKQNADNLKKEIDRAQGREAELVTSLASESVRAKKAEEALADSLSEETGRAQAAEKTLEDSVAAEATRAKAAEKRNADNLTSETSRAQGAEGLLGDNLAAEAARAKSAEKAVADDVAAETTRAKAAEQKNSVAIDAESVRAQTKEAELQGSIQAEKARAEAAEASIRGTIDTNKPVWDDKYTRNEVDNKFSALETAIDWKESVATFTDIAATYPHPEDGWTVNVKDTDYTYRWDGAAWVAISANAIPKATQGVDGLLSKEDKVNYDDAYGKRHTHGNKAILDKITQVMLDNLAAAFSHISDAVRHITAAERTNWNDAGSKKHTHANKGILDGVTQALMDNWNAAFSHVGNKSNPHAVTKSQVGLGNVPNVTTNNQAPTYEQADELENIVSGEKLSISLGKVMKALADFIAHKGDAVIHVTASERTDWNDSNSKKHSHSNKGVIDKVTQALLDNWSAAFTHISDAVKHVTAAERTKWNAVTNKVDKVSGKQLSTNDYTTAEKTKLSGIAAGAEVNVQADWDITDAGADGFIKNKPASMPASDVPAWAKAASKPAYAWTEVTGKPGTFPPAAHTHSKSQITDMPTKVSQLSNDAGYITQEDVDTSQNHTHANKTVLDKITQALLDNWSSAYSHISDAVKHVTAAERTSWNDANAKKHSHGNKTVLDKVTQAMMDTWNKALTELPVHTHTKSQITDFPASLPANGGTANYANYLNANNLAANTDLNAVTVPGYYYCPANATVAAFKNCPTANAFFMEVGKHAGVYQRVVEYTVSNPRTFERNYYSGTWGTWKNITVLTPVPAGAKFTDTVYSHPNSGAAAGTYRSVTVNAQGHVTGGSNPTTLAGYGITDAAAKSHNHDAAYLKKSGLTWGDLKGV